MELYKTCYRLNKTAARIYNKTISFIRKMKEKHDSWVSLGTVKKYILRWSDGKIDIHVHSKYAMVEQYFQALNSYFKVVKKNPKQKPPYKKRKFKPFIWKNTAVKLLDDGKLRLSMGSKQKPLEIQTTLPVGTEVREVRLVYENG